MTLTEAIIIGIVEGVTEFLPVSSTGHMIITSSLLGIQSDSFTKLFEISIQLGAILAVVVMYWKKFFRFRHWQFYAKLLVGVIPALIFGYLLSDKIDALLESPLTVAITLLLGGIVLLFIDNFFKHQTVESEEDISLKQSFLIGIWQVLAMVPGVSRSAASIIGGMQQKLTRNAAAEFSFFLAVPTMCAASGYKLLKEYKNIQPEHFQMLALGNIVAFVVAILAIKFFINYIKVYGFRIFGIYRIIAGIVLLILIWAGVI